MNPLRDVTFYRAGLLISDGHGLCVCVRVHACVQVRSKIA